jgi:single-stranded-DNA-specific exonuclease
LIESFGGHAAAAGLTVKLVNFVEFCEHFSETIKGLLNEENLKQTISTDGVLEAKDFTLALASQIESISPWGQKFPEPKFYGEFFIKERYVVGELHARLLLETDENVTNLSAIAFGAAEEDWFLNASRIKAVYHLAVNRYRGQETLQLNLDFAESV